MGLTFLTPLAGAVAAAAVLPVAAWLLAERRVGRARASLRLHAPRGSAWWVPVAIGLTLALVGLAAAQPVLSSTGGRSSERFGQVFVVLDTSESMRAGSPARFTRAVAAADRIDRSLRGTPVGLASVTDRVLPHLFPTIDQGDFHATLRGAMGIDRPPPSRARRQASGFDALAALGTGRFYIDDGRRVAVLLTDGESRAFAGNALAKALGGAHVKLIVVRFWKDGERIAGDDAYRADPSSVTQTRELANVLHTQAFEERDLGAAIDAVQTAVGTAENQNPPQGASSARPLAPYALLGALVPLGLIAWRRNFT